MPIGFRYYALIFAAFVIWGTQHPALKILSTQVPSILLNLIRFLIVLAVLLPFIPKQEKLPKGKDLVAVMALGIIGVALMGLLQVIGIKLSTATNSSLIINTNPLLIALLAPVLIGEATNWKRNFGALIGFIGVVFVVSNGENLTTIFKSEQAIGNILLFVTALCVAAYAIYSKSYIKKYGGLTTTFYAVLGGTITLLLVSLSKGELNKIASISLQSYLLVAYVAILTTAMTWVAWFDAIKRIGVIKTGTFFFLIPLSGIVSSYFILHERVTGFVAIGAIMVLSGIYLAQK